MTVNTSIFGGFPPSFMSCWLAMGDVSLLYDEWFKIVFFRTFNWETFKVILLEVRLDPLYDFIKGPTSGIYNLKTFIKALTICLMVLKNNR